VNTRSLSFRLVAWFAGLLTIIFVLLAALTVAAVRHYLEANLLQDQARRARQISHTLLAGVVRTGEDFVAAEVEALYAPTANDRFIRITRADGRVLYLSGDPRDHSFAPARVPPVSLTRYGEFSGAEPLADGSTLLIAALNQPEPGGARYVVEVGMSTRGIAATLQQLSILLAVGLPLAVLLAAAGGFVLVRRALRPVDRISQKAEQITQQNLSERLPVAHSGDELERLSISLNHMISRLEDAICNSKRFVADASHEIRTPLTVLHGELESLAQAPHVDHGIRESLGSMLEEVERLAAVVEGLLVVSRLDAGEAQAERVQFDLAQLVTTTADQMSLLAEDKNITVLCEAAERIIVEGDRARLKQVVVNLLDNAIKYTPAGGVVRLQVMAQEGHAVLDVMDNGIGIPPEALPYVFERFFRVDRSRSRDQGGAGLGLSIVKSICTAHGAEIQVMAQPEGGSRFRIRQPLATAGISQHGAAAAASHEH
jgi:heavy metal sensor kinase